MAWLVLTVYGHCTNLLILPPLVRMLCLLIMNNEASTEFVLLGGLRAILTDQNKLVVAVGGVTALAAGIYTTRYFLVLSLILIYVI